MYKTAVNYKGVWLVPNSEAFVLWQNREKGKNQELLDKLIEKCSNDKRKLEGTK